MDVYVDSSFEKGEPEAYNFTKVMENLTPNFSNGTSDDRIFTECVITSITEYTRRQLHSAHQHLRRLEQVELSIDYDITWSSKHTNVTDYGERYFDFVKENNNITIQALNEANVVVQRIGRFRNLSVKTDPPTVAPSLLPSKVASSPPSQQPTLLPSLFPSPQPTLKHSEFPSSLPSTEPSATPSVPPSVIPSSGPSRQPSTTPSLLPSKTPSTLPSKIPSNYPSVAPSVLPSSSPSKEPSSTPSTNPSLGPSESPSFEKSKVNTTAVFVSVGGVLGAGLLIFIGMCAKRRVPRDSDDSLPIPAVSVLSVSDAGNVLPDFSGITGADNVVYGRDERSIASADSSLLSTGSDDNDSDIDYESDDNRAGLQDEFDKYADQNLDNLRTQVQGTLSDAEGMMSQALTKALMGDSDDEDDVTADVAIDPTEVEASMLCEINIWLKNREGAGADERREYMQVQMNEMVSKVRRGIISPDDGSRIVHGCAAMLGLQLAESLPETALIVTGMRKKVSKKEMMAAFKEFGEIKNAAVSSNARGFGLIRFRNEQSCRKAIERSRVDEIVVQDVEVTVRMLRATDNSNGLGGIDLKRQYSNERKAYGK